MTAGVLSLDHVSKSFGPVRAVTDVTFEVRTGEVIALVGENGAGKSTLLKMLSGVHAPDAGRILIDGEAVVIASPARAARLGIAVIYQELSLIPWLSVAQNLFLGREREVGRIVLPKKRLHEKARAILSRLDADIDPGRPVATLGVAAQQMVEIARALSKNARFILMDEPTASLAAHETDVLFERIAALKSQGVGIVYISHRLEEIHRIADRIGVLRDGALVHTGPVGGKSIPEIVELMVGRPIPEPKVEPIPIGPVALSMRSVTLAGEGHPRLQNVSLDLHGNEIVGIAGVSGNGQGVLAEIISGIVAPSSGTVALFGQEIQHFNPAKMVSHGVARIPEDRHAVGVVGDLSLEENLISARYREAPFSQRGLIDWRKVREFATRIIAEYDVRCPGPQAATRLLSGGNMQKLILGREMARDPRIILANQPARGLDIGAVGYVHQQLLKARANGAGILLISEDLDELLALSDRIVVMYRGRMSAPMARRDVTIRHLGLMMAGHGFAGEAHAA